MNTAAQTAERFNKTPREAVIEHVLPFGWANHFFLVNPIEAPCCGAQTLWVIERDGAIRCQDCDREYQLSKLPAEVRPYCEAATRG